MCLCFLTLCTVGPVLGPGIVSGDCCKIHTSCQSQHTITHTESKYTEQTRLLHVIDQFYHFKNISQALVKPTQVTRIAHAHTFSGDI